MRKRTITLIAGPTASGKSDFALKLAQNNGSAVVNADSMQVYSVLRIITARPGEKDMADIDHYLYGYVAPNEYYSTGRWLKDVANFLDESGDTPLIFVGGTGLYFKALTEGLAQIPDIPQAVREHWRQRLKAEGASELHKILAQVDNCLAARVNSQDGQRIIRGLEVYEATGKPLSYWHNRKTKPLLADETVDKLLLIPERELVYRRIEKRFDHMVENGAIEEVKNLVQLKLDPQMPAMKAIGVPELIRVLEGSETLDAAIFSAKIETRRYAKRQTTWFRHQFGSDWKRI